MRLLKTLLTRKAAVVSPPLLTSNKKVDGGSRLPRAIGQAARLRGVRREHQLHTLRADGLVDLGRVDALGHHLLERAVG